MNMLITGSTMNRQPLSDECASDAAIKARLARAGHYAAWTALRLVSWPSGMT